MDAKTMPEKIILQDGTTREVPTQEEVKALEEKASKSEEHNKYFSQIKEDLGVTEGESLTEKLKGLKEDVGATNIDNVRKMRESLKEAKRVLKEKGIETDDEGKIKETPTGITQEETQKIVQETLAKERKESALSKFSEEERKQIEPALEKTMSLGGNMEENLSFVVDRLYPNKKQDPIRASANFVGGQNIPRSNPNDGITDETLDIANDLGISKDDLESRSKPLTKDEL